MIYKMTLKDSVDTMTFNLLETPIVDKDIEGAVDNVTLDGNQYTDYLYLKKQYIQKWAIMCPDEYDELRGFYTRQFEEGEVPLYRVYYGANVTRDYTLNGDYFQFNAEGIETGMTLSQLLGNAEQTGTPTPDSPVPISTVTGAQTITVTGKNLLGLQDGTLTSNGVNFAINNGTITASGTTTAASSAENDNIIGDLSRNGNYPVYATITEANSIELRAGTYTVSAEITKTGETSAGIAFGTGATMGARITGLTKLEVLIGDATGTYTKTATFTIAEGERLYVSTYYEGNATKKNVGFTISNIQLEQGSQATSYEPYQGQEFPIDLGSIELAKVGTYQDRIYKDDGKWYIEKQVRKVVLDGTGADIAMYATNKFRIPVADIFLQPSGASEPPITMSDYFVGSNYTAVSAGSADNIMSGYYNAHQLRIYSTKWASLADFTTWLSTHPTTVYYALATPTTTEITNEALLLQLNFLASLYGGVNNISLVGTGAQGEMAVLIRDVLDVETDVVPETPVRLTLTDGGVINACGCRRDVQLTMRETTE